MRDEFWPIKHEAISTLRGPIRTKLVLIFTFSHRATYWQQVMTCFRLYYTFLSG